MPKDLPHGWVKIHGIDTRTVVVSDTEFYTLGMRIDGRFLNKALSDVLNQKVSRLREDYDLYKDISERWFTEYEYAGEYVPLDKGGIQQVFDSHQKRMRIFAVCKKKDGSDKNYAAAQWYGKNGSGVPSSKWERANNYNHHGHRAWAVYARRTKWKKFIKDIAPRVIASMQKG